MDFFCAYHCGEWGSESIHTLEWEFVQCLYDAHKVSNYIAENYHKRKKWRRKHSQYKGFAPADVRFKYQRPENFLSLWYQKALEENPDWHVIFSDGLPGEWGCGGSQHIVWQIRHVNDNEGKHLGKYFIRRLHEEYLDENDLLVLNDDESDENLADYDFAHLEFQKKEIYTFGNFIDFNNACAAFEEDRLIEKNLIGVLT